MLFKSGFINLRDGKKKHVALFPDVSAVVVLQ